MGLPAHRTRKNLYFLQTVVGTAKGDSEEQLAAADDGKALFLPGVNLPIYSNSTGCLGVMPLFSFLI